MSERDLKNLPGYATSTNRTTSSIRRAIPDQYTALILSDTAKRAYPATMSIFCVILVYLFKRF